MNRVADGEVWLQRSVDGRAFLETIGDVCARYPVDLHAYCVLPGHYHLLVRAEPEGLSEGLAYLEGVSGFPGAGSPHTLPVAFGRHLMAVSRYIHLNPVDAGLVWCPEHWPYSSFRAYLGDTKAPRWVVTDAVLGRFGTVGARHRHRAYVLAGLDPSSRDLDGRPRWDPLFGPDSLVEDLAWRIEPVLTMAAVDSRPRGAPGASLHDLAHSIAQVFGVPAWVLRSVRAGGRTVSAARAAFIVAARSAGGHRLRDVAAFMGYASPSAAAAAAQRIDRAFRREPRAPP